MLLDCFYGCSGITQITSNLTIPPTIYNNSFYGVNKNIPVYVPCEYVGAYLNVQYWKPSDGGFTNYQCAVQVEPSSNSAVVTFPVIDNAETYTLLIFGDENHTDIIQELRLDANGNIIGKQMLSCTVSGLEASSQYYYSLTPYNADEYMITVFAGDFATTAATFVPVTNITNVPTIAVAGVSLTLKGTVIPSNATNQTILWSVKDAGTTGVNINGNEFLALSKGTAVVTATIPNGSEIGEDYAKDFNIIVSNVGIDNITSPQIVIFPNPTNGQLRIENYGIVVEDYSIFSPIGQLIMQGKLHNEATTISVSTLEKGIYYLKIADKTLKFVKQ
ncbi:MAG: T9SS type A sorting domain-containing protein [Lentimicrobiaceae bacterium]|nr:T9SS type A sorting domain-containing protein [Lentimicrobiaceae bacterium]